MPADWTFVAIVAGATGALARDVFGALGNFLNGLAKSRLEANKAKADEDSATHKTTIDEWQQIAKRLEEQNERSAAVIRQHQEVVQALSDDHADCREENAELRTAVRSIYGALKYLHDRAQKSGAFDPGQLPEMPELREREPSRAAFLVRQAAQSAELLKRSNEAE